MPPCHASSTDPDRLQGGVANVTWHSAVQSRSLATRRSNRLLAARLARSLALPDRREGASSRHAWSLCCHRRRRRHQPSRGAAGLADKRVELRRRRPLGPLRRLRCQLAVEARFALVVVARTRRCRRRTVHRGRRRGRIGCGPHGAKCGRVAAQLRRSATAATRVRVGRRAAIVPLLRAPVRSTLVRRLLWRSPRRCGAKRG